MTGEAKTGDDVRRARVYNLLEDIYGEYNKREYISPDPLEFVYEYSDVRDREAAGLIASSFAYGKVKSILVSVRRVLSALGTSPADALLSHGEEYFADKLRGFVHRFTACEETAKFLSGIGLALEKHGSLENLFWEGLKRGSAENLHGHGRVIYAMDSFARKLLDYAGLERSHLLPEAHLGSACKRLCMFIRWMARSDDVDPGCWSCVDKRDILVPIDTHMFRISSGLGFTRRKSADGKAAAETTLGFAAFRPDDPARYDFALTRFGIRTGMSVEELLARFQNPQAAPCPHIRPF